MQLTEAHISQLTEVSYAEAVKYKEQGFTVLGRTKHSHIAHRIIGLLVTSNEWYEYYITTELHNKLMNKRTPQQAFIDSKPAQEAWLAGKQLQYGYPKNPDVWLDMPASCEPRFADPAYIWRPKPEPEKVPFNQQTIPADAWFRKREGMAMYRPNMITFDGIALNGTMYFYSKLASDFEYSTDRVNWHPCYTLKA